MARARLAFGPSAVLTPANVLSATRLLAAPLFAIAIAHLGPQSWLLWGIWSLLAFSDSLDGLLARRHGSTSSGAFLDPLADKFLVLSALGSLAAISVLSWVPVALIGARELAMSLYRIYESRHGLSIPASALAKAKTLVQDIAIGLVFLPLVGPSHLYIARDLLWLAVALTLLSGAQYARAGQRHVQAKRQELVEAGRH